jgi:hypothetical protein
MGLLVALPLAILLGLVAGVYTGVCLLAWPVLAVIRWIRSRRATRRC